jgi:tripartite-type tricarboxylate transporter receptor subunit TctC
MKRLGFAVLIVSAVIMGVMDSANSAPKEPPYPTKPIQVIVPFPPGGWDLAIRPLAEVSESYLGQKIVVVNKPGGASVTGTAEAIQSRPDGYTLFVAGVGALSLQPHIGKVPYKVPDDFEPVLLLCSNPVMLVAGTHTPFKNLADVVQEAKKKPGDIKFGSPAPGSIQHLAVEMLNEKANIDLAHVPFQGAGPGVTALLGGHIDLYAGNPLESYEHVQTKKFRAIGIFDRKRSPEYPEVPTIAEQGYDLVVTVWFGIAAPKKTPPYIIQKVHDAFKKGMGDEKFVSKMSQMKQAISYLGPEDFRRFIKEQHDFNGKIISRLKAAGKLQ